MKHDPSLHSKIQFCRELGWSQALTARQLNLHRSFVQRWWKRAGADRKPGSGRPRILQPPVMKKLSSRLKRNPRLSSRKLAAQLSISRMTAERGIKSLGLFPYHRPSTIALTKSQKYRRLSWARQHRNFDFSKTMFVDEKIFVVADQPNPRNDIYFARTAAEVQPKAKLSHPIKINVCAGITSKGVTRLYLFTENMTGELYKNILSSTLLPDAKKLLGKRWTLAQDNDKKHTSKIVKAFLQESQVDVLDWPSGSPDLNPIENLWSIVNEKIMQKPPTSLASLKEKLKKEWNAISKNLLKKLFDSMPARLEAVIKAKGAKTKY